MAADTAATIVRVRAVVEGLPGLNQLKTAMRGISAESKAAGTDLRLVNDQLKGLKSEVNNSINNLRLQVQAFQAVRNSAKIGSDAYRDATLRLKELNRELDKAEGRRGRTGERLAGLGAVAGAGFFGGPEALLGSAAGLAFGGVGGAYAGAAIGAQVAMARKAAMDAADYSQQLAKLRLALQGVVDGTDEYNRALAVTENISQNLNVPIGEATRGFTRLTAAVVGAGGNVSDAEIVFKAVASAIKATGGSAEDVQGGLVAMSQVFSKGKLSAEELSGQLGERLPGAVTLFAKATGRTLPQLQKDLEQGVVGLNDVMKFSDELIRKYAANSDRMAKSTEDSGARMKVALDKLKVAFGDFFKPIKVEIDNLIAKFAELVAAAFRANVSTRDFNKARAQAISEANKKFGRTGVPTIFTLFGSPGYEEFVTERTGQILQQTKPAKPQLKPGTRTTFQEPKAIGEGSSTLSKLQSEFGKTIGVIGRQLDVKTQRDMLKEVFKLEKDIEKVLKSGTTEGVAELRQRQQVVALETAKKYLLEEQGLLYDEIKKAEQKGLKTVDAKVQLDRVSNEIAKIDNDILGLQNREREKSIELSKKLADQMKSLIPSYTEGAEEMPTVYKLMNDQIKELATTVQDTLPRLATLADGLSSAFAGAFEGMVFAAQSAQEALGQLFGNIAKSFQNMVIQMITDYLKLQIMTFFKNIFAPSPVSVAGNFFGAGNSTFTNANFGFGGIDSSLSSKTGLGNPLQYAGFKFAMGGIMSGNGPLKLRRYAAGGIASGPQLAMFGEGSRPEAYVPLPDGRTIPVTMKGNGNNVKVDSINITVQNTGQDLSPATQKRIANQVQGIVMANLVNERRSGGILR